MIDLLDQLTNIRKFRAALESYEAMVRDTRELAAACGFKLLAGPMPNRPVTLIASDGHTYTYPTLHDLLMAWRFVGAGRQSWAPPVAAAAAPHTLPRTRRKKTEVP